MAVYTILTAADLAELIGHYDVGDLISAKGIAEGVSNSNWLIETSAGRFILTMYESRVAIEDPFARQIPVGGAASFGDRAGAKRPHLRAHLA